jgi:MoaA/NifB/PqqE/SkfB family radical SAM enzyme
MASFRNSFLILKSILTKRNPLYVQFALSKNCNLRCGMCRAQQARADECELSLEEISELAQTLSKIGVVFLVITGGEPLLRPDLAGVIRIFSRCGLSVRLQTNAVVASEDMVAELARAGLQGVSISLESLFPQRQDAINARPGAWEAVMRGISVFSRCLPLKSGPCGLNIVVSRRNLAEIPALVRFASAIGFWASLIPVHISTDANYIVRSGENGFAFSQEDFPAIDRIYEEIKAMKKGGALIYNSTRFLSESPDFLKYAKTYWSCDSPQLYFSISPSGNFLPCVDLAMDEPMLGRNFAQRYRSRQFLEQVRAKVRGCGGCMYGCWPEISYFCRDLSVFMERGSDGIRAACLRRRPFSFEELLGLAENLRMTQPLRAGAG